MNSRITCSEDPVSAPVDDELVMADIDAGKYYGLNDVAAAIWENIETGTSVAELCERLCTVYDVSAEQCAADVLPFLKELAQRNLIMVENPGPA